MIQVRLRIPIEDLGGKEFLAHVGSWLFAVEYLNLRNVVQISLNRLLLHFLILSLDSLLCLSVKRAFWLQYLDFDFLCDASQVLVTATNFTFAYAATTLEEASIARSLEDRCADHHLLMLMLLLDRFECPSA